MEKLFKYERNQSGDLEFCDNDEMRNGTKRNFIFFVSFL